MRGSNFGKEDKVESESTVCLKREGKKGISLEIGANLGRLEPYKGAWWRGIVFSTLKLNNKALEGEIEWDVVLGGTVESCHIKAERKLHEDVFGNIV